MHRTTKLKILLSAFHNSFPSFSTFVLQSPTDNSPPAISAFLMQFAIYATSRTMIKLCVMVTLELIRSR